MNRIAAYAVALAAIGLTIQPNALAQTALELELDEHVRIEKPADLDANDAIAVYKEIAGQMAAGYALNDDRSARTYQDWLMFSSQPYLSAGHGNRYVNNYGNEISRDYLKLEEDDVMPVGSILAKDSFTVTEDKQIFGGALFLMEKLAEGQSPDTADWRYQMILPDGSLVGDTIGDNPEGMVFCHTCHIQAQFTDYVFGLAPAFSNPDLR